MHPAHRQGGYDVRFEWGLEGAEVLAPGADVAVVVDVLSFTTTLSVAVDLSIDVWPYRWRDDGASAYARRHDAVLAVGRSAARAARAETGVELPSLSPAGLRRVPAPPRLVLPSPNGSTIAFTLADHGLPVVAVCLRNATAVAGWLDEQRRWPSADVCKLAIIAAGERWSSGALRPAVEDLWGAGALIGALAGEGRSLSPEAEVARAAYEAVRGNEKRSLLGCASGRELTADGDEADVLIAAEVDTSTSVPLQIGQRFVSASGS